MNPDYSHLVLTPDCEKEQIPRLRPKVSGRRYYNPIQGRFLGRDPKGEAGGLNLYGFVANNPVNRWDYLGMVTMMPAFNAGYRQEVETLPSGCTVTTIFAPDDMAGGDGAEYIYDQWSTCPSGVDPSDPAPAPIIAGGGGVFGQIAGGDDVAPNKPERWSDEKCKGLAAQIGGMENALASGREKFGVESFSGLNVSREAQVRAQALYALPSGADIVSFAADSLTISGAVLGSGYFQNRFGPESGAIAGGLSAITNQALMAHHYRNGDYGAAMMHGVGAATDLYSVAANNVGHPLVKGSARALDWGKAGIAAAMVSYGIASEVSNYNSTIGHFETLLTGMQRAEAVNLQKTGELKALYDARCK